MSSGMFTTPSDRPVSTMTLSRTLVNSPKKPFQSPGTHNRGRSSTTCACCIARPPTQGCIHNHRSRRNDAPKSDLRATFYAKSPATDRAFGPARLGYRSGYDGRTRITRVGELEQPVPQDRHGRFSTELFDATGVRSTRS